MSSIPEVRYYRVNAFTATPAGGNPAGVVFGADGLSEATMQAVAAELAMSETAFVMAPTATAAAAGATHRVRFFTPTDEVDLCGHATIATFYQMAQLGLTRPATGRGDEVSLLAQETKAGVLPVRVLWRDGRPLRVMMDQAPPRILRRVTDAAELERIATLLGVTAADLRLGDVGPTVITTGLADLILPVRDRATLWRLEPDSPALAEYSRETGTFSIHAFTLETEELGHTAQCRDFSPLLGIPEESATGTASGATGTLLVAGGLVTAGAGGAAAAAGAKQTIRMELEQGYSMGLPSLITVEVDAAGATPLAVCVGGQAVAVRDGILKVE